MRANQITCLGTIIETDQYPVDAYEYLASFNALISIQALWAELDRVWDECLRKHKGKYSDAFYAEYYTHPVWCLNSVFSEIDPESISNRYALINEIESIGVDSVVDMGGGYGTFLKILKKQLPHLNVTLCEPYIFDETRAHLRESKIIVSKQTPSKAGAYIFLDVLEHLTNPLSYLEDVLSAVEPGSYLIFGNCFYPFIKCHLKSSFYLRHTFGLAAHLMGLRYIKSVKGAEYIHVYCLESQSGINHVVASLVSRVAAPSLPLLLWFSKFYKKAGRSLVRLVRS